MSTLVQTKGRFYVVGGAVNPDAPSYIERKADDELFERVMAGDYCHVLTSRQMGKSSLMARTAKRLAENGIQTAIVDLTLIGTEVSEAQWYYGIARRISRDLGMKADLKEWWQERSDLPALQRLTEFFSDIVLARTSSRVVIFIDEIDTTIALPFTDSFFTAIRACYNTRAARPEFHRFSFVLLGAASPSDLIKNKRRTPFNIGHLVDLTDFTYEEAKPLARDLCGGGDESQQALQHILSWTGGHPYLTQKLCQAVAEKRFEVAAVTDLDRQIASVVEEVFLSQQARRTEPNLNEVRDWLARDGDYSRRMLRLYRRIRQGREVMDAPLSPVHTALKLSGVLLPRQDGALRVRNRIYEQVFTADWAKAMMPADRSRLIAIAAVVLTVLCTSFSYWYFPSRYISAMRSANEEFPAVPYDSLRLIPGYGGTAERLRAEFWERRALLFETQGSRDEALLARLKALAVEPTENRRIEASNLVGPDYDNLLATYRHGAAINAVAFSPAGQVVITCSDDNTARLWRAGTGEFLRLLQHESAVRVAAFNFDGKIALTGGDDKTARLWRVETGQLIGKLEGHQGAILTAAFSPDGTLALTGADDNTACLWLTKTGQMIRRMRHQGPVRAVAFGPDGRTVLTGSDDHTARLWLADTGRPIGQPMRHKGAVRAIAFNPKAPIVITGGDDYVAQLWDAATGRPINKPMRHDGLIRAVTFSPDGQKVLTCGDDRTARMWLVGTGQAIGQPMRHLGLVLAMSFSPDGKLALTGSNDRTARLWRVDADSVQPLGQPLRHEDFVLSVAFSPDGKTALTGGRDGAARLWRVDSDSTRPIQAPIRHNDFALALALSADGQQAITGGADNSACVWRIKDDTAQRIGPPLPHQGAVRVVAFSRDGQKAITGDEDGVARVWRIGAESVRQIGQPLRHQGAIRAVAFSPDGQRALTGSADKTARLWRISGDIAQPVGAPLQHYGGVRAAAFSPNGELLLTVSDDNTAYLWRAETGQLLNQPMQHPDAVRAIAFSRDGMKVLTGSEDGAARLWRVEGAMVRLVSESMRHQGAVRAVAFSPDGKTALTGSNDRTARLWRIADDTAQPIGQPIRHENAVLAVAFSADGKTVMTATSWWAHLSNFSGDSVTPRASRLLSGYWTGAHRFINETREQLRVVFFVTGDALCAQDLDLGSAATATSSAFNPSLGEWQRKLALKFTDRDKISPMWEPESAK